MPRGLAYQFKNSPSCSYAAPAPSAHPSPPAHTHARICACSNSATPHTLPHPTPPLASQELLTFTTAACRGNGSVYGDEGCYYGHDDADRCPSPDYVARFWHTGHTPARLEEAAAHQQQQQDQERGAEHTPPRQAEADAPAAAACGPCGRRGGEEGVAVELRFDDSDGAAASWRVGGVGVGEAGAEEEEASNGAAADCGLDRLGSGPAPPAAAAAAGAAVEGADAWELLDGAGEVLATVASPCCAAPPAEAERLGRGQPAGLQAGERGGPTCRLQLERVLPGLGPGPVRHGSSGSSGCEEDAHCTLTTTVPHMAAYPAPAAGCAGLGVAPGGASALCSSPYQQQQPAKALAAAGLGLGAHAMPAAAPMAERTNMLPVGSNGNWGRA